MRQQSRCGQLSARLAPPGWRHSLTCHDGGVAGKNDHVVVHGCAPHQHAVEDEVTQPQFDAVRQPKGVLILLAVVEEPPPGELFPGVHWKQLGAAPPTLLQLFLLLLLPLMQQPLLLLLLLLLKMRGHEGGVFSAVTLWIAAACEQTGAQQLSASKNNRERLVQQAAVEAGRQLTVQLPSRCGHFLNCRL